MTFSVSKCQRQIQQPCDLERATLTEHHHTAKRVNHLDNPVRNLPAAHTGSVWVQADSRVAGYMRLTCYIQERMQVQNPVLLRNGF